MPPVAVMRRCLVAALLLFLAIAAFLHGVAASSPVGPAAGRAGAASAIAGNRALVVFPGIGCNRSGQLENVLANVRLMRQRFETPWDCLIYAYRDKASMALPSAQWAFLEANCRMLHYKDGQFAAILKTVTPTHLQVGGYSHVMVLLDDVTLYSFDLDDALLQAQQHDLAVVTPLVIGAQNPPTRWTSRSKKVGGGAYVNHVEFYLTVLRADAWGCFWELLEPLQLPSGGGADLLLYDYCTGRLPPPFQMGVLKDMVAQHRKKKGCRNEEKRQSQELLALGEALGQQGRNLANLSWIREWGPWGFDRAALEEFERERRAAAPRAKEGRFRSRARPSKRDDEDEEEEDGKEE